MLIAAAFRPRQVLGALRLRKTRLGANTAAMLALFLALMVLANYVAARHQSRLDLTESKTHTLSPQTTKIVRALKKDVGITAYYSQRRSYMRDYQRTEDMLNSYRAESRRVKAEIVDMDLEPSRALREGIQSVGTTVVKSDGRKEELFSPTEADLTSAILKVTREKKNKVYFLVGHGEHDPTSHGEESYSGMKRALERLQYEVQTLNLSVRGGAPDDCDVLVVAGPRSPLHPKEEQAIRKYLEASGKALILLDPEPSPGLAGLIREWGIEPLPDIVVEPELNFFGDASTVIVSQYEYHDIVRPFTTGRALACTFVLARGLKAVEPAPEGVMVTDLFKTSPESWLEKDFKGTVKPDPGEPKGPFTLGAVATSTRGKEKTRIVVIGDSDFAQDAYTPLNEGNSNLFLNSLNWLAEEEELISIEPKSPDARPVTLTATQVRLTFFLTVMAIPLLFLAAGAVVWWRRR